MPLQNEKKKNEAPIKKLKTRCLLGVPPPNYRNPSNDRNLHRRMHTEQ